MSISSNAVLLSKRTESFTVCLIDGSWVCVCVSVCVCLPCLYMSGVCVSLIVCACLVCHIAYYITCHSLSASSPMLLDIR